jgi:predicted aminopeptidase
MKKSLKLILSTLLLTQLNSCYLISQGYNLLKYNLSARPLEQVYQDPNIKEDTKKKIKLIFEIREFAISHIGLKQNKTYTKFVQLNDKNYLVNVLVASKPDKLEAYQWSFPFFGSFPYKGFYDLNEAREEQKRLKNLGYDTYIRTAGAFSTLGWFDDPIYSYMLNYSTEYLANLVIHEMTHATVFIKDNIQFNEELASFVGDQGAVEFLKYKYGEDSKEYKASFDIKEDNKLFSKSVNEFYNSLNSLYNDPNKTREQKLAEKKEIIADFRYNKFPQTEKMFKTKGAYSWFPKIRFNNAVVMGFITYEQDASLYHRLFEKQGNDLRKTIDAFKLIEKSAPQNPKQFLKDYVEGKIQG